MQRSPEASVDATPVQTVRAPDGTRIGYRRVGSGPPVVALHGGLGTAGSWAPVAERLADRFEFFLVDRRGRGASGDGPAAHTLAAEVDDARAVLRVAGPGAALVGHSYGGAIALETALRAAPGEVAAVAVYEPAVGVGGLIPTSEFNRIDELLRAGRHAAALEHGFAQLDAAGLVARARMPAGARRPKALLDMAWTVSRELRAVDALGNDLSRYRSLEPPVLVLAGTASPQRQRRLCHEVARTVPHGQIVSLRELGHVAHTAAPDTVATALSPFLQAVLHDRSASSTRGFPMSTVLFACLRNAGRSQMSAALLERAAGGRHRALSAGSEAEPSGHVHPNVVEVMREIGIDLSDRRPQRLTPGLAEQADVVITMGCGDACPFIPGKRYIDWDLPDPAGRPLEEVRALRDDIDRRIRELVDELDRQPSGA